MMTGTWYRGFHLERIGWLDAWKITDPLGNVLQVKGPTWNESVRAIDQIATEPVPSRVTCCICAQIEVLHWNVDTNLRLLKECLCFNCDFWLDRLQKCQNPNSAIVNHHAYTIVEDETGDRRWSGHGGSEFRIKFFDGRSVISHNLWHQGDIPDRFQPLMPDNAEFTP